MATLLRSIAISLISLGLTLVPLLVHADADDAEAQRLSASRKAERYNLMLPQSSIRAGGAKIYMDAPLAIARKVALDYAHYSEFMPQFQRSRIVGKKDGLTDVYLEVPILHGAATVWAVTRFSPPVKEGVNGERIEGKLADTPLNSSESKLLEKSSNVQDLRAIWHLRPVDERHTIAKLEILLVPKLPLPGQLITPELEYASDKGITAARDRAEAKAVQSASDGTAQSN